MSCPQWLPHSMFAINSSLACKLGSVLLLSMILRLELHVFAVSSFVACQTICVCIFFLTSKSACFAMPVCTSSASSVCCLVFLRACEVFARWCRECVWRVVCGRSVVCVGWSGEFVVRRCSRGFVSPPIGFLTFIAALFVFS
jgi:hypothetical protein